MMTSKWYSTRHHVESKAQCLKNSQNIPWMTTRVNDKLCFIRHKWLLQPSYDMSSTDSPHIVIFNYAIRIESILMLAVLYDVMSSQRKLLLHSTSCWFKLKLLHQNFTWHHVECSTNTNTISTLQLERHSNDQLKATTNCTRHRSCIRHHVECNICKHLNM